MEFELESPRLGFTRFTNADAPALARIIADPRVARTITANVATEQQQLEVARERITWHNRFWESHGLGVWALRLKDHPTDVIGWSGFMPAHIGDDAEILYGIAPTHWGRGLAFEAAGTVVDWLYANTDRPGISASIFAGNPASERVAEKLGMRRGPDLPIADFADDLDEVREVIAYDLWRLGTARDEETAGEIGHRIGQMTGVLLDADQVWGQVMEHLTEADLIDAVRGGFSRGLANPAIIYYRTDRPTV